MNLEKIYREEDLFPGEIAQWEKRTYGFLFYNEEDQDSFDSNHAVIFRDKVYDIKKVLKDIQSPNLQIIFDPVNLLDKTNIAGYHDVLKEAIDVLGEDVAVVHLKDFAIKNGEVEELAVGQGQMEYDELTRFMKYDKPYIHATLENTAPENAVAAREYIQKLWDEA